MRWAVPLLCLLGAGGLWAWALFSPKEAKLSPLPTRFAGSYEVVGFDPPKDRGMESPLPAGEEQTYTFREDGTYVVSARVGPGYELRRTQGLVSVDADGVLALTPVSTNLREDRAPAERFHAEWGKDAEGPLLLLRHLAAGFTYRLRPKPPEPPKAAAEPPR